MVANVESMFYCQDSAMARTGKSSGTCVKFARSIKVSWT